MNQKLIIILMSVSLSLVTNSWGQLLNEDFNNGDCYVNTCGCCIVNWIDNDFCLPGWSSSHGSPNTIRNGDFPEDGTNISNLNIEGQAVMMYHLFTGTSSGFPRSQGEGLFTNYDFSQGECYRIKFDLSTNTPIGNLRVRAANGLVGNPSTGMSNCTNLAPNPAEREDIDIIDLLTINTGNFQRWKNIEIIYSPDMDFSQFLFYPENPNNAKGQVRVILDNLSIEEICPTSFEFTDPLVDIPANNYHAASFISTGTNGGSGTINSATNESTTFRAGQFIQLNPQTQIEVSGLNFFQMEIAPCSSPPGCPIVPSSKVIEIKEKKTLENEFEVKIFPNPNNGRFTLALPKLFNEVGTAEIMIYTQLGKVIHQEVTNQSSLEINLSQLQAGIYLVSTRIGDQLFTKRFTIQ